MSTLLERLNSLKDQSGMNAKQLTLELGISSTSFTDWGKGKGSPSVNVLEKFSDYFHVSLDWLVRGEEFNKPNLLEYSNSSDMLLLDKYHSLTPELREKLIAYLDGMLAAMPIAATKEKRLL